MSIDYKIWPKKERGFRYLKQNPRYFQEVPKSGPIKFFIPGEEEKSSEKSSEKKQVSDNNEQQKKAAENARKSSHQTQKNAQNEQLKNFQLNRRGETKEERKERTDQKKRTETLEKNAAGLTHERAEGQDHYNPNSRARMESSTRGTMLQNIRNLAGNNHGTLGEKAYLAKENLPHLTKNSSSQDQAGTKLGNMRGFIGESGTMNHEQWNQRSNLGNRRLSGQAFMHDRPFAGLGGQGLSNPLNQTNSLNHLIKQLETKPLETHPALAHQIGQSAAGFHSKNLLLVRDGDKFRLFRLLEDGTLSEAGGEHHGKPLSADAKRSISQALKERGLQARLQGEREVLGEKGKASNEKNAKDASLTARGELKALLGDESSFAHLLRAALEEGREIGDHLREGANPEFISKKDWNAFFARMLNVGNLEESSSKTFDEIMSFVFRGLFKKEGGDTLVSDIKYMLEGKQREEKFAQISISDDELLNGLRGLKPGQGISKEMLQDFMGNQLDFIKLVHLIGIADPGYASEILKNVKFNASANIDPFSQARLEHHIFSQSKRKEPGENTGVFADPFKLQEKPKLEFFGANAKLYTLIGYLAAGFAILLLLFYLLK